MPPAATRARRASCDKGAQGGTGVDGSQRCSAHAPRCEHPDYICANAQSRWGAALTMCRSGEWSPYDVCADEAEKEEMKRIVNLCKENASHIGQVRSLLGNNLTILTFVERGRGGAGDSDLFVKEKAHG